MLLSPCFPVFQRNSCIGHVSSPRDLRMIHSSGEGLHPNRGCSSKHTRIHHTEGRSLARFRTSRFCRELSLSRRNSVRNKSYPSLVPSRFNVFYQFTDFSLPTILFNHGASYDNVCACSDGFFCLFARFDAASHD